MIPLSTRRSSTRGLSRTFGKSGRSRSTCSSDCQNCRLITPPKVGQHESANRLERQICHTSLALVVTECLARLEAEMDLVILPPFWYGAASHAVAGPEGTGSLHVDAETLVPVVDR